jgi:ATP-dependent Clp endopeptidase proteolytic subunit ClpP
MKNLEFLKIENRKGRLKLNSGVHKESADKLIEELETLYGASAVAAGMTLGDVVCAADDALEGVEVEINSPGGSVFEGVRIYNALRDASSRGVHVTATVNGIAASMGSVILMAGDERKMTKGSRVMIHEASTMAMGDARAMTKAAALLEGISSELAGIYADRTGKDKDYIRDMMLAETWMNADDAEANGFIHSVVGGGQVDKSADSVKQEPMSIFASIFKSAPTEEIEAAQAKFDALQADYDAASADVTKLTNELATANETIAENIANISTITESNEKMTAELSEAQSQIETLKNEVESAKASAGEQAVAMLASVGQTEPLAEVEEESKTITVDAFWEKYNILKNEDPKEATKFFQANAEKLGLKVQ